jgi:hypothetical protein
MSIINLNSSYGYSVQQISNIARKPFEQGLPDQLIGLRGGRLLRAIRAHLGWSPTELKRQIEQNEHASFTVGTITSSWESGNNISVRGAHILGSLFGIDPGLFNPKAGTSEVHESEYISPHLQEGAPPQTSFSLVQREESAQSLSAEEWEKRNNELFEDSPICLDDQSEVQGLVSKKRSWQTANASGEIDSRLLDRGATSVQDLSQLPVNVPSGPIQVIGLRGGQLIKKILIYYGWTREDLQRQIEQTQRGIYIPLDTIHRWESTGRISWRSAKVLGSLFKLDADLFYTKSNKTCQSWTPPLLQKRERSSSESVQKRSFLPLPGQKGTAERISNAINRHLQESAPQTSFSLIQRGESAQPLSAEEWEKLNNELFEDSPICLDD